MKNIFFKKKSNIKINDILSTLKIKKITKNFKVNDINNLDEASFKDISFFHSIKYLPFLKKTNAKIILTEKKFLKFIPKSIKHIIVPDVLLSVAIVTSIFYPDSKNELFDSSAKNIVNKKYINLKLGKNILLGKNVKIGKNCTIGHNTIVEQNVIIGDNCNIGSNVIIKFSQIGNNTNILDGAIIGKKGFGFHYGKQKNINYPHIGSVIIGNNVEIGCNNTIDRGSLSNTTIGDGTYLDSQVHIAHNVKIGKNCIITGQVGFAGSSTIGNRVMIGGQTGISGHLTIGDNVKIGGGSGVINDIPSNTNVMGYPAKNIRNFITENKKNDKIK